MSEIDQVVIRGIQESKLLDKEVNSWSTFKSISFTHSSVEFTYLKKGGSIV